MSRLKKVMITILANVVLWIVEVLIENRYQEEIGKWSTGFWRVLRAVFENDKIVFLSLIAVSSGVALLWPDRKSKKSECGEAYQPQKWIRAFDALVYIRDRTGVKRPTTSEIGGVSVAWRVMLDEILRGMTEAAGSGKIHVWGCMGSLSDPEPIDSEMFRIHGFKFHNPYYNAEEIVVGTGEHGAIQYGNIFMLRREVEAAWPPVPQAPET